MARVFAAIGVATLLSACANAITPPSHLGMTADASDGATHESANASPPPDAIRHVSSNRVLGAMAFQKVTGADVDPRTLARASAP